jgi:hypothetical protein
MRRVKILVAAILALAMLIAAVAPAGAQEWIQSNSIPSYLMWCDWYGSEYWCYAVDGGFWVRAL